jgi:hypothetical protein
MAIDPANTPPAEPVQVNTTWLEAAQQGQVLYVSRDPAGPRPPGGDGGRGLGSDVPPEGKGKQS